MPRETFVEKGARYAAEGRLTIVVVTRTGIAARCKGSGRIYDLGWHAERGWHCDCPAKGACAHLHALGLVVVIPPESRDAW